MQNHWGLYVKNYVACDLDPEATRVIHEILTLGHVKSIFYLSFETTASCQSFLEIETHKSKESFAKGIFIQLSLENQLFEN